MLNIFLSEIPVNLDLTVYEEFLRKEMDLPGLAHNRQSIAGWLVAINIFCKYFNSKLNNDQVYNFLTHDLIFKQNNYGKPYIANHPRLKYNLSHSETTVAIGISYEDIGIDIEKISTAKMDVAERFFTPSEYNFLSSCPNEQQLNILFYTLWTLKESYIKYLGTGFHTPLNSFSFDISNANIKFNSDTDSSTYQFHSQCLNDYVLSICGKSRLDSILNVKFSSVTNFWNELI